MNIHVKTDVHDLPAEEKVRRFERELADTPREDRVKVVRKYLDPNAPVHVGAVSVALGGVVGITSWRNSALDRNSEIKELYDTTDFIVVPPAKREALARVDSLVGKLVAEWKRGNAPLLDGLLTQVFPGTWKSGTPITEDALRMLATKSLEKAEMKRAAQDAKRVVR
jgi:hypothetical protein